MRLPALVISISILLLGGGARAAPDDPIGSAITVVNYVTASLETESAPRQLSSGDDVRQQELIETDADILKKGVKVGIGVGIGLGVGYGLAKMMKGRKY
jgi:hypothetical protein